MLKLLARLPITVARARTEEALCQAIALRKAAYGRHYRQVLEAWPDAPCADELAGRQLVLVAYSRATGAPVGTITLTDSRFAPLSFARQVALPEALTRAHLVGASRLGVTATTEGRIARLALWKMFWRYARAVRADAMALASTAALEPAYRRVGFIDVVDAGLFFEMPSLDGARHRVLWAPMRGQSSRFLRAHGWPRCLPAIAFMLAPHPELERVRVAAGASPFPLEPAVAAPHVPPALGLAASEPALRQP